MSLAFCRPPVRRRKVLRNERAGGAAEVVDAIGPVLADINLAVRVRDLVDDAHPLPHAVAPRARLAEARRPDADPKTPSRRRYRRIRDLEYRIHVLHQWRRRAVRAKRRAHSPPHERQWRCLQRYEGPWSDAHDPYWGGLQMDKSFMRMYAPRHLLSRGWANRWTPIEQMWVAERALRAGRGFYPWPNTARMCGLI